MNTPEGKPLTFGALRGVKYVFGPGDGLPRHVHDDASAHTTNVMRGSVVVRSGVYVENGDPGDIFYFPAGMEHEIVAGPSGATIVNYFTGSAP